MASSLGNAPTFVRSSLLGKAGSASVGRNLTYHVPPILTLPPEMSLDRLVTSVVDAYGLQLEPAFWQIQADPAATQDYSLRVFDFGLEMVDEGNYRGASDIISICNLVYPNYYYQYTLALVRFQLRDYQGALNLMEQALGEIREKKALSLPLAALAKEADFTASFYNFYITILLFNSNREQARAIVEFVLNNRIITEATALINLIRQYRTTDDRQTMALLGRAAVDAVHSINDDAWREQLMIQLRQVLV